MSSDEKARCRELLNDEILQLAAATSRVMLHSFVAWLYEFAPDPILFTRERLVEMYDDYLNQPERDDDPTPFPGPH